MKDMIRRKILAGAAAAAFVGAMALAGCGGNGAAGTSGNQNEAAESSAVAEYEPNPDIDSSQYIGLDAAKDFAFEGFDLSEGDVTDYHVELAADESGWAYYAVEFDADGKKYELKIDALSGEINETAITE